MFNFVMKDSVKRIEVEMHKLLTKHFPLAAIAIIAASFSFGCETRETTFQAGYNIQPKQTHDSRRKQNDAAFLLEASEELLLETQLAELAIKEATSTKVKEYAISVLTEHNIAIEEIHEMASRIDVVIPEDIAGSHKKRYSIIAKKSGLQFDRAYCDFMSENNSIVLKKFEKIVQDGNHKFVKDWAWGKLGILKRQITLAQEIEHRELDASHLIESSLE